MTRFGQLTIMRPSKQNLEQGACNSNNAYVIWDLIRLTNILKYIKNTGVNKTTIATNKINTEQSTKNSRTLSLHGVQLL